MKNWKQQHLSKHLQPACTLIPLDKSLDCDQSVWIFATQSRSGSKIRSSHTCNAEVVIHAMRDIFANEDTEAVLLTDAENAFSSINQKVMLHNLNFICPIITTYITNCYITLARLFIIDGGEMLSKEGTTQSDPTAMGAHALGILPLNHFLLEFIQINRLSAK